MEMTATIIKTGSGRIASVSCEVTDVYSGYLSRYHPLETVLNERVQRDLANYITGWSLPLTPCPKQIL